MDWDNVIITTHAWERFITRWPAEVLPECPMSELMRLLAKSEEEDIGSIGRTLRIISNGFKDAQYFAVDGWRFVVNADGVLVTCERIIHKKKALKRRTRRRR